MKLKSFHKAKNSVNSTKWQPTEWGNIFINSTSDRGLISKIYKELKKQDINKLTNSIKMGYRSEQRIFNKGISNGWEILKEMFSILSHLANANQNDRDSILHLSEWLRSKNTSDSSFWRRCGAREHSSIADRSTNFI